MTCDGMRSPAASTATTPRVIDDLDDIGGDGRRWAHPRDAARAPPAWRGIAWLMAWSLGLWLAVSAGLALTPTSVTGPHAAVVADAAAIDATAQDECACPLPTVAEGAAGEAAEERSPDASIHAGPRRADRASGRWPPTAASAQPPSIVLAANERPPKRLGHALA